MRSLPLDEERADADARDNARKITVIRMGQFRSACLFISDPHRVRPHVSYL